MKTTSLFFLVYLFTCLSVSSQSQWTAYTNMDDGRDVAISGNHVWTTSNGGVLHRDTLGNIIASFNQNDGITGDLKDIEIDFAGNIWCTSDNHGLFKFDGNSWTNYNTSNSAIASNFLYGIDSDPNGTIWVGSTNTGLIKFDGSNWSYFSSTNYFVDLNYVISVTIDDQGYKWIGTTTNLIQFDDSDTTWTQYDQSSTGQNINLVRAVKRDTSGHVWCVNSYGLFFFNDTTWTLYNSVNTDLPNAGFYDLYIDSNNVKWIATADSGLVKFDTSSAAVIFNKINSPLPENRLLTATPDDNGKLWMGHSRGVTKFDFGNNWINYDTRFEGLVNNNVLSITFDDQGRKWIGTGNGLSLFNDTTWVSYDSTNSILSGYYFGGGSKGPDGHVWLGHDKGLLECDGTLLNNYTNANSALSGIFARDVKVDGANTKWIVSGNDLNKLDSSGWTIYDQSNSPISPGPIMTEEIDFFGNKWLGIYGGYICKFDGLNWTSYYNFNGPGYNYVTCSAVDLSGNVWFGTWNNGLYKYDGFTWQHYTQSNSPLHYNTVNAINFDRYGNGYVSSNGIQKFHEDTWEDVLLFNTMVFGATNIEFDEQDNVWFCSGNGLFKYAPDTTSSSGKKVVKGKVFYDENSNGLKDNNEEYLSGIRVKMMPDSIYSYTNTIGEYAFLADTQSVNTISVEPQGYRIPLSGTLTVPVQYSDTTLNDYALGQVDTVLYLTNFTNIGSRCNTASTFWYSFKNIGSVDDSMALAIVLDTALTLNASSPMYDSIVGNIAYYNYSQVSPLADNLISLTVMLPDFTHMGDTLHSFASVISHTEGTTTITQTDRVITCAYDPNVKEVQPLGYTSANYTLKSSTLKYTIQFQNTGNDTAYNINIRDQLSNYLDWSTFQLTGSSHPVSLEISSSGEYNFCFYHIMLPDSNTNEPASHGFVSFDIKCLPNIPEQTMIDNTAYIYFDSNPAVVTNTTHSNMVTSFPAVGIKDAAGIPQQDVSVIPHPLQKQSTIVFSNPLQQKVQLTITDMLGRELYTTTTNDSSILLNRASFVGSGFYLYRLRYENGKISCGKLLVE